MAHDTEWASLPVLQRVKKREDKGKLDTITDTLNNNIITTDLSHLSIRTRISHTVR